MPDTYNENEIVKLKHLNEFARQLTIKLDGGTDPKPARTILANGPAMLFLDNGNKYISLSQTPAVTLPKSQLPLSNNCLSLALYAQTPLDVLMCINDIKATGDWQVYNYQYQNPKTAAAHQWRLVIQGPNATDTDVVSFTIHFDETPDFAAYDLPVEVTITEG